MAMPVAWVLLSVEPILFHFLSRWWSTPIASNWKMMDDTVNITFVVTGIVFVAVNLFMACAVFLYRHRQGRRAEYAPENKKLEWWLTILTSLGDRKSTRLNSSHLVISYAVFCLKKKKLLTIDAILTR